MYRLDCLITTQVVVGLGLNANATENNGNAPAHFAAMEGHLECLKLLVYHKNQPLEVISKRNNDVSQTCTEYIQCTCVFLCVL